jgi:hypothetical protein
MARNPYCITAAALHFFARTLTSKYLPYTNRKDAARTEWDGIRTEWDEKAVSDGMLYAPKLSTCKIKGDRQ